MGDNHLFYQVEQPGARTTADAAPLTAREREYIALVCRFPEPTVHEIAEYMGLSPNTVLTHRRKVYRKLGVSCRLDLYHRAIALGLVVCRCCQQRHGA